MSFTKNLERERRYIILRFLEEAGGEEGLGLGIMQSALAAALHPVSQDILKADAQWLDDHGLASVDSEGDKLTLRLTRRGAEIVRGFATHPGLRKPIDQI